MQKLLDVVIVGAGIGGLSVAHLLGKYNLKVALLDSKEDLNKVTFHTLGSFLDLDRFGLSRDVVAAKQTECIFHSSHFHIKKKGKAYILNKQKLYKELLDKAIQNKVEVFSSTYIKDVSTDTNGIITSISDEKGNTFTAKIFIDATGVEGLFSRKFGLQDEHLNIASGLEYNAKYFGPQYQSHLFIGNLFRGGYGWIFPFGNNRAIVGYGSSNEIVRSHLKDKLNAMLEIPFIKKLVKKDNDELSGGTIPVDIKTKFVYKNVLCIGDSVSQVNPIVGEGHRFILEAGLMAAPAIQQAILQNNPELLHGYEIDWNKKFYKDYIWSKRGQVFANKLSKHDILSDIATLFLATKRNSTFVNLLAGHIRPRYILFP